MTVSVKFYNFSHVRIECEQSIFFELKDYFSFFADGYKFNPKYKYGNWSGKIYLLDNNALLPMGLAKNVKKFCENMGYQFQIDPSILEQEDITEAEFKEWVASKKIFDGLKEIKPYWYQEAAAFKGIKERRKILSLPTSAGKSLIQALMARYYVENYEGKILILVPTTALTIQMRDDFLNYRLFKPSEVLEIRGGTARDSDAVVYVSTWQTAIKQPPEWLAQFGMLLNDEMHLATGVSISKIINNLTNCMFKSGLSGSLKDGKANMMQYEGLFGSIYKPVSTADLMEAGQVTKLKINALMLKYSEAACKAMKGFTYQEEIKNIIGFKKRNAIIEKLATKLASKKENVFVMFRYKAHGTALFENIKKLHNEKDVYFINGDIDTDERDKLKKLLEQKTGIVVVASYGVFSTGISVKNLHHVIFAHGTKSKITVLQSIGRILRKHDSKTIATLWDIIDDAGIAPKSKDSKKKYSHMNYCLQHGIDRIERYASEQFDYSIRNIAL